MQADISLSIVIPVLDEAAGIEATLAPLQPCRRHGCEVIVCDGGSRDDTVVKATPLADRVIRAPRGRAAQLNAGAASARGDVLLFLHADTLLPEGAAELILDGLKRRGRIWGRFDMRLSGSHPLLRMVETLMNLRSRLTGIATGDHGLFVERKWFENLGGFPDIALMEDIAFSKRLKTTGPPLCLKQRVVSSSRRWETYGILNTIVLMWWLRLRYFLGADPNRLATLYSRGVKWKRSSA